MLGLGRRRGKGSIGLREEEERKTVNEKEIMRMKLKKTNFIFRQIQYTRAYDNKCVPVNLICVIISGRP